MLIHNEKRRLLLHALTRHPALNRGASHQGDVDAPGDSPNVISLQSGRSQFSLSPKHIAYVAAEENYCSIHFLDAKDRAPLMVRKTFSQLIGLLPSASFFQIHRSYVINMRFVASIDASGTGRAVILRNGLRLPIARARLAETRLRLAQIPVLAETVSADPSLGKPETGALRTQARGSRTDRPPAPN